MNSLRAALKALARINAVRKLKEVHEKAFGSKFLLVTNLSISLSLSTVGDVLEQQYERFSGEIDAWNPTRTSHMAISGVTVGLICHYWYKLLDRHMPGRTISTVAKKILLDQLICSPIYISVFFLTLGILEQKTQEEVFDEMRAKAWKLYAAEWMVWPSAQFINFYWIPSRYRIFYDNMVSLGYDVYTSQIKHRHKHI